ncbi:hypothetical protein [Kitasatospora sp. McL0602]|uniref:hypothetical protein n=1 Tax=Kitasatospora sp. McL0602 TaxID=3439530 RepID=UPI003F8B198B
MAVVRGWPRAVASAGLLLLAATACASAQAPAPAPSPSASASPSALATPTDRSPHGVLLSGQLAMHTARRARFSYLLDGSSATGMLFWAPKTVLQLQRTGATNQLMVLDTTAYVGGDQATAARLGGRHWEKYVTATGEVPYAALVDRLNPVVALTAAAASDSPVLVGEEKLGDTTCRHYRVVTTVDAYVAAQTQLSRPRRDALHAALAQGGRTTLTLDLWLGDKDELVQLRRTGGSGTAKLDDTVRYSDVEGSSLSVQAPGETDTFDAGRGSLPEVTG